jgi:DNA-binding transcriptional regulator YhcF (GntR family)
VNVTIDTTSPVPPYEQLRAQLHDLVAGGELTAGTRLPPIRQLAGDLGLAVNTVGRAYKELEAARVIETRGRHGTVVLGAPRPGPDAPSRLAAAARRYALDARHQGADLDAAAAALRIAFAAPDDSAVPLRAIPSPTAPRAPGATGVPTPDPVGDR